MKQRIFLTCPAEEILFGGAAGGGKSDALLIAAIGNSTDGVFTNPNWKVLILRRTFPELERSLIWRSQQLFHNFGKYDSNKHRWTFPGGGLIQFGHIKTDSDVVNYQSAEYSLIIFDELTHFTERMYLYLFSRLRSTDPKIHCKIKSATNPGGIGHGWVKKRFIDDKEPLTIYKTDTVVNGKTVTWGQCFIPATVYDNKYLVNNDPMYVKRLMELPEAEKRALLYGDWNVFSGQFFPEFDGSHIIEPFKIPKDWPIWISMDWGFATKCAIVFVAQDPTTDHYYMFDEIYVTGKRASEVADLIKIKLGDHFVNLVGRYADKRIMVKDEETQISTKQKFSSQGLYFTLATDDRVPGWHSLREMLLKDKEGNVGFHVFKTCKDFIRVIPEQIYDMNKPEDLERHGETHMADAIRYFSIMRKHTDRGQDAAIPYQVNPVTGYVGMGGEGMPLRTQIRRLTNAKRGIHYFFDSKPKGSDE